MNNKDFIKALEGIAELRERIIGAVVPAEAQQHFRSSRKEALLGLRSIIDYSIGRLDEQPPKKAQEQKHSSHDIEITD